MIKYVCTSLEAIRKIVPENINISRVDKNYVLSESSKNISILQKYFHIAD